MTKPPAGTSHGTLRWYVHRVTAPQRFGEQPSIRWVVTPIILGRGSEGVRTGAHTRCDSRDAALRFAHAEARRTYGPREARS
ncbi:hypothetical protein ACYX8G_19530 [Microbacterium saperdae]